MVAWRGRPVHKGAAPVFLDWAIHDIDLARFLFREEVSRVECLHESLLAVNLRLYTASGREARIHASSTRRGERRKLWIDGRSSDLARGAQDPLAVQLDAFIAAAQGAPQRRLASLADAAKALEIVEMASSAASAAA